MTIKIMQTDAVQTLLKKVAGLDNNNGDARTKQIVHRIVSDLYQAIEDLDITPDEFWRGVYYLNDLGTEIPEAALVAPGLGFDHYLDLRMDAEDEAAGISGGTPRTIEGPLYVAGAPSSEGFARMDDGSQDGDTMLLTGQVKDTDGNPIAGATVELWHADLKGAYSYFDPTQSDYNLRRTIVTDANGRYTARTIVPSGYSVPPNGSSDQLLTLLGRHGNRPAHVHYFVSKPGYLHLTTQVNLAGDKYTYDDFAFGTRDELVVEAHSSSNAKEIAAYDLPENYQRAEFDVVLNASSEATRETRHHRARALQD